MTLFAWIDHAEGAQAAGLELGPEGGCHLRQCPKRYALDADDPQIGIELPLRILVWQQGEQVLLGYHDPRELGSAYDVQAHDSTLEAMSALLEQLTDEAAA